ncbi:putative acyl-CoA:6-aminopenicillanic-acid-acyltransferase [Aspergillus stella-maris]|uniref:putative acyl-CoA:6-aminopenicillanic-acid-acyltransferase n=1 Tax=Aspergillus stella-maris TaxID=1810926 RepID=UPI003CCE1CDF
MLVVKCSGSSHEIGFQHGSAAKEHIARSIEFYASLFQKTSSLAWKDVLSFAVPFAERIKSAWPNYYDEMEGVAEGSGHSILDIVALNVRTEIAFGAFSDGCTSLAWHTENQGFLAQNWDWQPAQKQNLIILDIDQVSKPSIKMVTEAGIIGKIGFNSSGVGVCLNAIRAKGVDTNKLPVHLALRMALDSSSAREGVDILKEKYGVASPAHILIADSTESMGCEFTSTTSAVITADERGRVIHSNHLLLPHPGVHDTAWLADSPFRIQRVVKLTDEILSIWEPSFEAVAGIFRDRANAPAAICRNGEFETLFNIVMDLKARKAMVVLGMPDSGEGALGLGF